MKNCIKIAMLALGFTAYGLSSFAEVQVMPGGGVNNYYYCVQNPDAPECASAVEVPLYPYSFYGDGYYYGGGYGRHHHRHHGHHGHHRGGHRR